MNLPNENLLFWSVVDNKQGQIRWLPANAQSYKDNTTITTSARYAGDYRWNAISVDYYERNAIMSDSLTNSIYNAREWFQSEGDAVQTVFGTSGYLVNAIAVDWFSRSLYWIDEGFNWIRMSSYDSVKTTLIIGTGLDKPQGIAVYPVNGYIFWTDSGRRTIERSSLSGKNRTILFENLREPTDIIVDATVNGGRLYWIDRTTIYGENHTLESSDCNGQGRRIEYNLLYQEGTLLDIAVDENFIFVAIQSLQGSFIRYLNKGDNTVFYDLSLQEEVLDICVSGNEIQPYTGSVDKSIKMVRIADGELPEVLFQRIGRVEGIAVDWFAKNIYWTDYAFNHIVVCSYDSRFVRELFTNDVIKPRGIAIDPFEKLLFWSEFGPPGQIESSNLDGSNRRVLNVLIDMDQPSGITLDLSQQRLYYANRQDGSINYMKYDGTNLNTLYVHPDGYLNFFDLSIYQDFIFWTESTGDRNGVYVIYNENEIGIDGSLLDDTIIYAIETYDQSYYFSILALPIMADNFYLIADQEKHAIFQMRGNEPFEYTGLNLGEIVTPEAIAYDPLERRVYWIDGSIVQRSSLDGSNVESIIKDENIIAPKGIAVDYITRLVFWTDSVLRKIEVSYLDGS
ncbi:low-density lipoprotein receptor-related protein 1-like, partial [Antedon mediterranea]|uniref:low-density lipoprotein receptor-related protein 1-like n=1 Tax=Antedon mediterranea TaxID=105859 RepID=UPI003AF80051